MTQNFLRATSQSSHKDCERRVINCRLRWRRSVCLAASRALDVLSGTQPRCEVSAMKDNRQVMTKIVYVVNIFIQQLAE